MQTNVDVLDQYALSIQKAASRIIDLCLGPYEYPAAEIETGAWDLGSAAPLIRWRVWGFGVHPSTPCDYTKVTLVHVHYNFVKIAFRLVASMLGFTCQAVLPHLLLVWSTFVLGGSVAMKGFVLYIGGDISCTLNAMLLVQYVSRRVVM